MTTKMETTPGNVYFYQVTQFFTRGSSLMLISVLKWFIVHVLMPNVG